MWSVIAKLIVIVVLGALIAWKGRNICRGMQPPAGICALEARLWPKNEKLEDKRGLHARRNIQPTSFPEVPRPEPRPQRGDVP